MKRLQIKLIDLSIRFPRTVIALMLLLAVGLGSQMPRIQVDTDPENMLPADETSRVFHNMTKKTFTLYDMIVVGVVNESAASGVFNVHSLTRVHELTRAIEKIDGVIRRDINSLASIDNISQGGPGVVRFEWIMSEPPATEDDAASIRDAAMRLPIVNGTVISEDGRVTAIYVPIVDKGQSHRIAKQIEQTIAGFDGPERYFITGLPVAEDTFGIEMFKQMGISAPLAGLIILLAMWLFFRSVALILAPMIMAMATITITMGLFIACGYPVHIMSSMIPIFLMPIAVVDSVHILSEFADLFPHGKDRKETLREVMTNLRQPMYYTSLTSAVGFLSLVFAPIPPVRTFGVFVAIGITVAFYLTLTFIPAYVTQLSDAHIAKLARRGPYRANPLAKLLYSLGPRTLSRSKLIVILTVVVVAVSVIGISQIQINDNPVRWFRKSHSIRVADRVLNKHFSGTYNAYLVFRKTSDESVWRGLENDVASLLDEAIETDGVDLTGKWRGLQSYAAATVARLDALIDTVSAKVDDSPDEREAFLWEDVLELIEGAQTQAKYFQTPAALHYIEDLQAAMIRSERVGKSISIADLVKTIHRELRDGNPDYYTIPDSPNAVAQTLLSYQSSHRPHDLWHFVTPDLRAANIWLQLKSGDSQDMSRIVEMVDAYVADHPLPEGVSMDWAGLTFLNVIWQNHMVSGMRSALLGSFVIVFIMMLVLFRSVGFGLLAMLPLSVTIALIYGVVGLAGKDYDMPIAVLSSLTLGLSVDFAIHFLQRAREIYKETSNWQETIARMFSEPARAISRNMVVIAFGFLPLLASPLVPYNTVGFFMAMIMIISCGVTLVLLPAVMNFFPRRLFDHHNGADQN